MIVTVNQTAGLKEADAAIIYEDDTAPPGALSVLTGWVTDIPANFNVTVGMDIHHVG